MSNELKQCLIERLESLNFCEQIGSNRTTFIKTFESAGKDSDENPMVFVTTGCAVHLMDSGFITINLVVMVPIMDTDGDVDGIKHEDLVLYSGPVLSVDFFDSLIENLKITEIVETCDIEAARKWRISQGCPENVIPKPMSLLKFVIFHEQDAKRSWVESGKETIDSSDLEDKEKSLLKASLVYISQYIDSDTLGKVVTDLEINLNDQDDDEDECDHEGCNCQKDLKGPEGINGGCALYP